MSALIPLVIAVIWLLRLCFSPATEPEPSHLPHPQAWWDYHHGQAPTPFDTTVPNWNKVTHAQRAAWISRLQKISNADVAEKEAHVVALKGLEAAVQRLADLPPDSPERKAAEAAACAAYVQAFGAPSMGGVVDLTTRREEG